MPSFQVLRIVACGLGIATAALSGCDQVGRPGGAGVTESSDHESDQGDTPGRDGPGADGGPSFGKKVEPGSLKIGGAAPPLTIDRWVLGEPIDGFVPGKVYVIDFWATWSKTSYDTLPHLSKFQKRYGDRVRIVGVAGEGYDIVVSFLERKTSDDKKWRDEINCRLALDSGDATKAAYMDAAAQQLKPVAFIVGRDGLIEWIGHPLKISDPLDQIVQGDWIRKAAIERFPHEQALRDAAPKLELMRLYKKWDELLESLTELEGKFSDFSDFVVIL
ncbi:MAG: hypothetical protein JJ992_21820, partial [Planctomycetes bacterium]|nr:hypothetical protein [Planctomycetota bacterium]